MPQHRYRSFRASSRTFPLYATCALANPPEVAHYSSIYSSEAQGYNNEFECRRVEADTRGSVARNEGVSAFQFEVVCLSCTAGSVADHNSSGVMAPAEWEDGKTIADA